MFKQVQWLRISIISCGILFLGKVPSGFAQTNPGPSDPQYTWDLTPLYPTLEAWTAAKAALQTDISTLSAFRGQLSKDPETLLKALQIYFETEKQLSRISIYASLKSDENTDDAPNLGHKKDAENLAILFSEASSFLAPELIALGKEKIENFIRSDSKLGEYHFFLEETLRLAEHTLSADGEKLLSGASQLADAPMSIRESLTDANMPYPKVKLSTGGDKILLDQSGFVHAREAANRKDRKKVFDLFFGTYKKFEQTLGVTLYSGLKGHNYLAKSRGFASSLESALAQNNIPVSVYETLVNEANAGLPTLHRYLKLRQKFLGLPDLWYHDLYASLAKSDRQFSFQDSKALLFQAIKPLGAEYTKGFQRAYDEHWIDVFSRPKKRSGGYMSGEAYDVHPYILLNYTGNYESASTEIHEMGHAMHSVLTSSHQPYQYSDYSIFIAEIASTVNEMLLSEAMIANAKTDEEKIFYLSEQIDLLRQTFFRQAMFADFEKQIHDLVDKGASLTGKNLTDLYLNLLKKYHGEAEGVMKIDPRHATEWAYVSHFYYNFYVYQYATSIAAAADIVNRIQSGDTAELENYLNLLKAGSSANPYELVKRAGVDLATPGPCRSLIARMNAKLNEIEAIMKSKT